MRIVVWNENGGKGLSEAQAALILGAFSIVSILAWEGIKAVTPHVVQGVKNLAESIKAKLQ